MPGLSLWLSPPPSHPLTSALTSLIASLSDELSSTAETNPHFLPHITITSNIPPTIDPEVIVAFAAALFSSSSSTTSTSLDVNLTSVDFGPAYFKKIFFRVERSAGLLYLASKVRHSFVPGYALIPGSAEIWTGNEYDPHLSLVYMADWPLSQETMNRAIDKANLSIATASISSWSGGRIALYETQGSADKWKCLAYRDL
ncbi:2',3'-cyclic-nucleotide 3'-phosphodiesterase [Lipomyces oligophaga]|uniref:2',3'-cyclic-nucleotide 3'-phosphodiesterase n=1 Tax=Lipomyces oligophaga TaxID=45792 RepID=UPI0034CDC645